MPCDFNDYVTADDDVLTCEILSDQEICNSIMQAPRGRVEDSDEKDDAPDNDCSYKPVSPRVLDILKKALCSAG